MISSIDQARLESHFRRAENRRGGFCSERERLRSLEYVLEVAYPRYLEARDEKAIAQIERWVALVVMLGHVDEVSEHTRFTIRQWTLNRCFPQAAPMPPKIRF